jgi:hypothetical protein
MPEEFVNFHGTVTFQNVYLVECAQQDVHNMRHSTAAIAIKPIIDFRTHQARWGTNTKNEACIEWTKIVPNIARLVGPNPSSEKIVADSSPDEITFSKNNNVLRLRKLTLALFNQEVRSQVAGGGTLNFKNDDEVQKFFLSQDFEG